MEWEDKCNSRWCGRVDSFVETLAGKGRVAANADAGRRTSIEG